MDRCPMCDHHPRVTIAAKAGKWGGSAICSCRRIEVFAWSKIDPHAALGDLIQQVDAEAKRLLSESAT